MPDPAQSQHLFRRMTGSPVVRAVVSLLLVFLLGVIFNADGAFLQWDTHRDMLRQVSVYGILACGMTVVIIAGLSLPLPSPALFVMRCQKNFLDEIQKIIEAFGEAALRVKEPGADGVEIHMAHGYLINQFLSTFSNKREDEYGGDADRRMRMALEVLRAVRNKVGSDFSVICRLSADEYVDGGLKIDASKEIAKVLERNGADALHVSACVAASGYLNHPYYADEGVFVHLAQGIKSIVGVPVITVGRIRTPELANQILEENSADLISMGRALIADPHLPLKAFQGKTDEIIPCISCNRCILSIRKGALQCVVNPETGREGIFKLQKTDPPKKIWIVGGGPAGMKTAESCRPSRSSSDFV